MPEKVPINIKRPQNSNLVDNQDNYLELFLNLQDNLKLFLSILIIGNFFIIFTVKFLNNVNKKIQNFFNHNNNNSNNSESKQSTLQSKKIEENLIKKNTKETIDKPQLEKSDELINIIKKDVILFIIAHPDDEVMFFSPTLKYLTSKMEKEPEKFDVRILCLSNGNYDNIGKIREDEFSKVMKNLKIKNFMIVNDERIKDDLYLFWDKDLVCEKIFEYFARNNEEGFDSITHVVTFDENGVTNHPNHISCYNGLE